MEVYLDEVQAASFASSWSPIVWKLSRLISISIGLKQLGSESHGPSSSLNLGNFFLFWPILTGMFKLWLDTSRPHSVSSTTTTSSEYKFSRKSFYTLANVIPHDYCRVAVDEY